MTKITPYQIKEELVVFFRNSDIFTITQRGVTTTTDDGGAVSASFSYTVSTNPTLIKNVRAVKFDGSTARLKTDYTVNYETGVITFTNARTAVLTVMYDQGTSDKIYPDYPQPHLKINSFPRIAVDIISGNTREVELGAGSNQSSYIVSVTGYDRSQKNVEDLIGLVREKVMDNKKNFEYLTFITPSSMGPLIPSPFGDNKVFQRNQDFEVLYVFEQ